MTRKVVWFTIPYILGLFYAITSKIDLLAAFLTVPFIVFFGVRLINTKSKIILCFIGFFVGFFCLNFYNSNVYEPILKLADDETIYKFTGKITDISTEKQDSATFTLDGKINGKNLKLLYYGELNADFADKITADVTIKTIKNKYTFPAKTYYYSNGIFVQIAEMSNIYTETPDFSFERSVGKFREKLIFQFSKILDFDEQAILSALLLGETTDISDEINDNFRVTGISHITSVSGFHFAIITAMLLFCFRKLKTNYVLSFFSIQIILILFVILTGYGITVVRSYIMCTIFMSARLFSRKANILNTLCIAIIFMTIFTPYIATNTSFILSVVGVYACGTVAPAFIGLGDAVSQEDDKKRENIGFFTILRNFFTKISKSFLFMCVVAAVILPATMLFFNEASLISPISNVIVVPILSIVLIIAAISSIFTLFGFFPVPLIWLVGLLIKFSLFLLNILKKVPTLPVGNDNYRYIVLVLIVCILAVYLLKFNLKFCKRVFAICLSAFVLVIIVDKKSDKSFKMETFGSVTIFSQGSVADIIDTGKSRFDWKSAMVYLDEAGITKINNIILLNYQQFLYAKYKNLNSENIYIKDGYIENLQNARYLPPELVIEYEKFTLITGTENEPFVLFSR